MTTDLVAMVDRVSDGAASAFIAAARPRAEATIAAAVSRWPRATGRSAAAFAVDVRVIAKGNAAEIEVAVVNTAAGRSKKDKRWAAYADKIRWSMKSTADIEATVQAAAARAKTPEAAASAASYMRRKLTRAHGKGAPDQQSRGRQPWRSLVRAPMESQAIPLAEDTAAALARLVR